MGVDERVEEVGGEEEEEEGVDVEVDLMENWWWEATLESRSLSSAREPTQVVSKDCSKVCKTGIFLIKITLKQTRIIDTIIF